MKKLYKNGDILKQTEIWAEGFDKWYSLSMVSQFRWTICCETQSNNDELNCVTTQYGLFNLSEMCTLILDTLIQMCAFFPSKYFLLGLIFYILFIEMKRVQLYVRYQKLKKFYLNQFICIKLYNCF